MALIPSSTVSVTTMETFSKLRFSTVEITSGLLETRLEVLSFYSKRMVTRLFSATYSV